MGQICPTVVLHFMTFSPRLETNVALQSSSDSFPHMVIYILFVDNCQTYISTHCCLPIAGRLFYNVRDPGYESATQAFSISCSTLCKSLTFPLFPCFFFVVVFLLLMKWVHFNARISSVLEDFQGLHLSTLCMIFMEEIVSNCFQGLLI